MSIDQTAKQNRSERGQSLIELALTLTLLLILLAGAVDFGRAFFTYVALRDAAQEGANYGAINPTESDPGEQVELRVRDSSDHPVDLTNTASIQVVTTLLGAPCLGNGIQVDVTYIDFPITMPFLGAILGTQTLPIHATVTATILAPSCD